jgi:hypothetical protein
MGVQMLTSIMSVDAPTRYDYETTLDEGQRLELADGGVHVKLADTAYPVVADPLWLAPWVVRCLMGLGLNSVQITRIAQSGSIWAIASSFGYAAVRCLLGR